MNVPTLRLRHLMLYDVFAAAAKCEGVINFADSIRSGGMPPKTVVDFIYDLCRAFEVIPDYLVVRVASVDKCGDTFSLEFAGDRSKQCTIAYLSDIVMTRYHVLDRIQIIHHEANTKRLAHRYRWLIMESCESMSKSPVPATVLQMQQRQQEVLSRQAFAANTGFSIGPIGGLLGGLLGGL